jgi:hypothetical protein
LKVNSYLKKGVFMKQKSIIFILLLFLVCSLIHATTETKDPIIVTAPISVGELIDKVTILQIKLERIQDPTKLKNVTFEYSILAQTLSLYVPLIRRAQ